MTEPIIDAHHHIWRRADQPWLQGPTVPRIFGPYDAIKRDYPIEEFLTDIEGTGVTGSVYVQTNWAPERAVEEVEWVQSVADRTGWPHAIIGFCNLFGEDAAAVLAAQAKSPLLRGVRQQLHWHDNPQYRFARGPNEMADPVFRDNLARLADLGLLFELQVFSGQMEDAAALVEAFPDLTFVLEHAGMLEDTAPEPRQRWREGMVRLAACPNLHTKLSGLGTFIHRNDPAHIAEVMLETVEMFGAGRCVWGSNFPIEKLWTDYGALVQAARDALAPLTPADRSAVLHDNAARLYRLQAG